MRSEKRPAQVRRVYTPQGENIERLVVRYLGVAGWRTVMGRRGKKAGGGGTQFPRRSLYPPFARGRGPRGKRQRGKPAGPSDGVRAFG